jgi:archaellum component FlaC
MSKTQTSVLWILAAVLVYSVFLENSIKTDVEKYKSSIETLQKDVDSINRENQVLNSNIEQFYDEIIKIDSSISKVQVNIKSIKKQTNEKINSVDNYKFSKLEKFFSERYGNKTSTTSSKTSN